MSRNDTSVMQSQDLQDDNDSILPTSSFTHAFERRYSLFVLRDLFRSAGTSAGVGVIRGAFRPHFSANFRPPECDVNDTVAQQLFLLKLSRFPGFWEINLILQSSPFSLCVEVHWKDMERRSLATPGGHGSIFTSYLVK